MADIIIVSNRLPISVKKTDGKLEFFPSVGGLATGLSSYVTNGKSKWIGWPGIASDELTPDDKRTIEIELLKSNCYPVYLTRKQLNDFYNVFSNSVLWPLFHSLAIEPANYSTYWRSYRSVNEIFKHAVLRLSRPKSTIWVHDYQLLLLPELIRQERPADKIGFFLHIPFPDKDSLSSIRYDKQLIKGMLGADLIGFHTKSYTQHFLDAAEMVDGIFTSANNIHNGSRVTYVADFPMGIDYEKYSIAQNKQNIRAKARKLRQRYGRQKVILTVDRLDPTKGLLERLEAYKLLLATRPKLHGKVVLVMLAVPSRTEIAAYQNLKQKIEALVIDINTAYGTRLWKPVDYMYTSLPFDELTALYQIADVAFITPVRDGMNLVAKEYLASKKKQNGVLILSETAGAAEELTEALIVDPKRRPAMVEALYNALTMPKQELKRRVSEMQHYLSSHTVHDWAGGFIKRLQSSHRLLVKPMNTYIEQEIASSYARARKRQIFLDYDGVLVPFENKPEDAMPSKQIISLLKKLSSDSHTTVTLISGRKKQDLDSWFKNLNLTLVAEHGMSVRIPGSFWQDFMDTLPDWKHLIKPIMEEFAEITPEAFVEEKTYALVWHYRLSPPYQAQKNLVLMKKVLQPLLKGSQLKLYSGNKILEVKPVYANKGLTTKKILEKKADFILAIGDDYTDEEMFAALPSTAYTVKVGSGRTHARFRLKNVQEVKNLLKKL